MSPHPLLSRARAALCATVLATSLGSALAADITLRSDEVGKLLHQWASDGTAAGLNALSYENRDGQHSPLNSALWPQLTVRQPTPEETSANKSTGPATEIRPAPTIGNCSMAAPADRGGSLARHYFMDPGGNRFLFQQYLGNNLFIYPEHQDHDPGAQGVGGWGDLFPLNSPAPLISQGSSGSDQPFLQAVLSTIAAFPPDTQRLLIEKRLLIPTIQQILRRSSRLIETDDDYFTGQAHPVVFDVKNLDEKSMVLAANRMTPAAIPPIALIQVLDETPFEPGAHFYEPDNPHPYQLSDTPVSIARIYRGRQPDFQMLLSAEKSADLMGRPLTLRWSVLQGNPAAVQLEQTKGKPTVRLRFRWQPPVTAPASGIRSHRVDLALFADNGISVSAPAIVSVLMLPNEMRFYDDQGRVSEICYQTHNPDLGLPTTPGDRRWLTVIKSCILRGDGLSSTLMERALEAEERAFLNDAWTRLSPFDERLTLLDADPERKADADRTRQLLEQQLSEFLTTPLPGTRKLTCQKTIETALSAIARFTDLYLSFQPQLNQLAAQSSDPTALGALKSELDRLTALGVLIPQANGQYTALHTTENRTEAENHYLQGLNLTVLSHILYPAALERKPDPAWADPRLTTRKAWRDVFRYDDSGQCEGFVRHYASRTAWFDDKGRWHRDGPGPDTQAVPVVYLPDPELGLRFEPAN